MIFRVELPTFQSGSAYAAVQLLDVSVAAIRWSVVSVVEQPKDKRRKEIRHSVDTNATAWRRLDHTGRLQYEREFFRSILGDAVYLEVLRKAWEMAMPEELKEKETTSNG